MSVARKPNAKGTDALMALFAALARQGKQRGPKPHRLKYSDRNPYRRRGRR
jgi:hypothetical protein